MFPDSKVAETSHWATQVYHTSLDRDFHHTSQRHHRWSFGIQASILSALWWNNNKTSKETNGYYTEVLVPKTWRNMDCFFFYFTVLGSCWRWDGSNCDAQQNSSRWITSWKDGNFGERWTKYQQDYVLQDEWADSAGSSWISRLDWSWFLHNSHCLQCIWQKDRTVWERNWSTLYGFAFVLQVQCC